MPQLDLMTFVIQLSLILFLFWSLTLFFQYIILPQYLEFMLHKELSWQTTNVLVILIKQSLTLFFLHNLYLSSKIYKIYKNFINSLKDLAITLTFSFIKIILKIDNFNKYKLIKISQILNKLSGNSSKLNFLLLNNKKFNFIKKFYLNGFNEKKREIKKTDLYSRIIVKNTRKYRLLEDETRINNLINGPLVSWLNIKNKLNSKLSI
jgi:hypothetical protein